MSCAVRCFVCGREVQSKFTKYLELLKNGCSIKMALDECGLPMHGPFQSSNGPCPPSMCCRAMLMASIDQSENYNRYQRAIQWAGGMCENECNAQESKDEKTK